MKKPKSNVYFPIEMQSVYIRFDIKTNRMAFFDEKEYYKVPESLECNSLKSNFLYEYEKYFKECFNSEKAMKRYIYENCDFYGNVTLSYIKTVKGKEINKTFSMKSNCKLTQPDLGVLTNRQMEELFSEYKYRDVSRFFFYEQGDYSYTQRIFRVSDMFGNIFDIKHNILKDINLPHKDRMFFIDKSVRYSNTEGRTTLEKDGVMWVKGCEISKLIEQNVKENFG